MFDFGMTDLEENAMGPDGRKVVADVIARLDAVRSKITERVQPHSPADEQVKLMKMERGLQAAAFVLAGLRTTLPDAH